MFIYLWEKVRPRCWWNLLQFVANQWLFEDKPFPSLAQEGTVVIDDTPAEKFGLKMENVAPIRIRGKQIGLGFAIFSACVILPNVTIPIAA